MTPWLLTALAALLWAVTVALCAAQRSEIRYLRTLLAEKRDHQRRVERAAAGLPEIGPEREKPDPCPPEVQTRIDTAIGVWDNQATKDQLMQDVRQWRRDGREWHWIANELESEVA